MVTAHEWQQQIQAWQASGLTPAVYCRQHGLNPNTFNGWRRRYRAAPASAPGVRHAGLGGGVAPMPGLIPRPTALWLVVAPVDLRWGADGLSLYIQQVLHDDPGAGNAYLFRHQRGNRIKLLVWDGTGVWLCQRRLYRGQFVWPRPGDPVFALTPEQWQWLVAGVDWQRLTAVPPAGFRL